MARGLFKRASRKNAKLRPGHCVVVVPDGWEFGSDELGNPEFFIVDWPGIPVEKVRKYEAPITEIDVEPITGNPFERITGRRKWRLKIEEMESGLRTKVDGARTLTVKASADDRQSRDTTWESIRTLMWNEEESRSETEDLDNRIREQQWR